MPFSTSAQDVIDNIFKRLLRQFGYREDSIGMSIGATLGGAVSIDDNDHIVYVDSSAGADTNDGSSATLAVKTVDRGMALLPKSWRKKCRLIFAPGTYELASGFQLYTGEPVGPEAEPLVWLGSHVDVGLGSCTITSHTGTTVTASALNMVADAYVGYRIRFTDGAAEGSSYLIVQNTSDTITINDPDGFGDVPNDGSHFVVEKPAVIITGSTFYVHGGNAPKSMGWALKGIKFNMTSGWRGNSGLRIQAEGCEWDMGGGGVLSLQRGAQLIASGLAGFLPDISSAGAFSCGVYLHSGATSGGVNALFNSEMANFFVFRSIGVNIGKESRFDVIGLNAKNSSITIDGGWMSQSGDGIISNSPAVGLTFKNGGHGVNIADLNISNSHDEGVLITTGAYAMLNNISGTSNGGAGISAQNGGRAEINSDCTIDGADGEIQIGSLFKTQAELTTESIVSDRSLASVFRPGLEGDLPQLPVRGGSDYKMTSVNDTDYTVLDSDELIIIEDMTAPRTITLPAPSNLNAGHRFQIKDGSGVCDVGTELTIQAADSSIIDGQTSWTINNPFALFTVVSTGSVYLVV